MADLLIIAVIFLIVCAAAAFIIREKKRGVQCIGCSASTCPHRGKGCGHREKESNKN